MSEIYYTADCIRFKDAPLAYASGFFRLASKVQGCITSNTKVAPVDHDECTLTELCIRPYNSQASLMVSDDLLHSFGLVAKIRIPISPRPQGSTMQCGLIDVGLTPEIEAVRQADKAKKSTTKDKKPVMA